MPITLTELVSDFADAAVAMNHVCQVSSLRSLAGDQVCQNERFSPPSQPFLLGGQEVDIPIAALKNHNGLQADKLRMSLTTDALLEGRTLAFDSPQEFQPIKGVSGDDDSANRREGFLLSGPSSYRFGNTSVQDTLTLHGNEYDIQAFIYGPNAEFVQIRFESETEAKSFIGLQLRVWNLDGPESVTLDLGDAERTGTTRCYLTWRSFDDMDWFRDLPEGSAFGLSFIDALHNQKVADALGRRDFRDGDTYFDILVTFTEGLGESASKLTLTAEFAHADAPEGVALLLDRLNRDIRAQLE